MSASWVSTSPTTRPTSRRATTRLRSSTFGEASPPAPRWPPSRWWAPGPRPLPAAPSPAAMARDLASAGLEIVSGLARGIDAAAHQGALEGKGRTVAVLGSGLDRMYPPEHEGLARQLVEQGGALLSEFPLGTGPRPHHFPQRNRIIAGLVPGGGGGGGEGAQRGPVHGPPGQRRRARGAGGAGPSHGGALRRLQRAPPRRRRSRALGDGRGGGARPGDGGHNQGCPERGRYPRFPETRPAPGSGRAPVPLRPPGGELLARLSLLEVEARVRRLPGPAYLRA